MKKQVWEYLHGLISGEGIHTPFEAVKALDSAFRYASNKQQAWEDLKRLLSDKDENVQRLAVEVMKKNSPIYLINSRHGRFYTKLHLKKIFSFK